MSVHHTPLTPTVFHILLALSLKERHGYEIMKQAEEDSAGAVTMGPGALYGAIKRLVQDNLIEEVEERPDPELDDERRKYYRLTQKGKSCLSVELRRLEELVEVGKRRKLIHAHAFAA
ncbi:MAG: PadR family transcriptional regulator [Candidatus Peribacteria bacterium]|nr:PadR family transcriptional regulator [Candidatus Peribacteria bacterium]